MAKQLSEDALAYFREQGAKGGKIGGKRAAALLSPAERTARATKASQAAVAARTKKKRNREMYELRRDGWTYQQIGHKFRVSSGRAREVVRAVDWPADELDPKQSADLARTKKKHAKKD